MPRSTGATDVFIYLFSLDILKKKKEPRIPPRPWSCKTTGDDSGRHALYGGSAEAGQDGRAQVSSLQPKKKKWGSVQWLVLHRSSLVFPARTNGGLLVRMSISQLCTGGADARLAHQLLGDDHVECAFVLQVRWWGAERRSDLPQIAQSHVIMAPEGHLLPLLLTNVVCSGVMMRRLTLKLPWSLTLVRSNWVNWLEGEPSRQLSDVMSSPVWGVISLCLVLSPLERSCSRESNSASPVWTTHFFAWSV